MALMPPANLSAQNCQRGLSLIELLIALVLGVVLSFGAANLFVQNKRSFFQDEQSARMQEGGRYAQRYIARELSMAGFYGGVLRGDDINTTNLTSGADNCYDWLNDTSRAFEHRNNIVDSAGKELTTNQELPTDCLSGTDTLEVGTDLLVFRRVEDDRSFERDEDGNEIPAIPSFDAAKIYLQLEDYNTQVILDEGDELDTSGTKPMSVWEYAPQLLFIRNWSVTNGDGVPALCRKRLGDGAMGNTTCLVEGVENLQVEFGMDTDGDYAPDRFHDAPADALLSQAMSARVYILMRSADPLPGYTNDKSYNLGAETIAAANDGFYRRVYQINVMLRNSEALGI